MEIGGLRSEIKAAVKEAFQDLWHLLREEIREDLRQHWDSLRSDEHASMSSNEIPARSVNGDANPVSTGRGSQVSLKSLARISSKNRVSMRPIESVADNAIITPPRDPLRKNMTEEHSLLGKGSRSSTESIRTRLKHLVKTPCFEQSVGLVVLMNSVLMGMETSYQASVPRGTKLPEYVETLEAGFCIFFIAELSARIWAYGRAFFNWHEEGFKWNTMDCFLVSLMLIDHSEFFLTWLNISMNFSVLRMFCLVRILRISRTVRVFHLFQELKIMVSSMAQSMSSLMSAMFLLLVMIYVSSVVFMQIILNHLDMTEAPELSRWFGSLPLTILTLFECIVGGVSWDRVVEPLVRKISPLMGVLFVVYISGALFAMTNLITGVFVTNVTSILREDKDETMAAMIRDTFLSTHDGTGTDAINWDTFCAKLETPVMKEYLKNIGVEVSEAKGLFELIDEDGGGTLDGDEIIKGFMKLRGPAKSLELSLLSRKVNDIHRDIVEASNFKRYGPESGSPRTAMTWRHRL